MTNPAFKSPYENLRKSTDFTDILRLSLNVPRQHIFKIRSVLMDYGAVQIAQALLIHYLYQYVTTNKLTIDNRDQLINHIVDLLDPSSFVVRPASGGPDQTSSRADDRRATRPVHQGSKGTKNQSTTGVRK